ncbi:hypothetical protein FHX49_000886 [Microbacterium endophyticum]|uniref:Glutaminase n=1 Tax=Microbacterium endophyticum TaxID=1526412 RepID=A0A7W4V2V6_9MICO|nr:glutaminase [Microbacterium endophyticum]MBB2975320.1 hypothetical protein [Microbacterium endophyticum]NIK35661.1 hypothetical protein [Microbacterium endophyticum]
MRDVDPAVSAELLAEARMRLAHIPREPLGRWHQPRRILGFSRAARIVREGEAWHLGVLLLTDSELLSTGEVVRSREPARRGFAAQSQRERAEHAAAAYRGGFPEGDTVHVDWRIIDLAAVSRGEASGPLSVVDGDIRVRWSRGGLSQPLDVYLDDRISLLVNPPDRAN